MRHLIMGTAGHIDHGKTTLIKALTGFDCDTHPEEKKRGITIHLGFTHLKLTEDLEIGVIDVPGHKNFVNTMISGVNSIDFVLLVISADSGIMPQTREHLDILKLMGVRQGIVVINKCDLVNADELELLELELHDFLRGSFLEKSSIVAVSAKSGINIDMLIEKIKEICSGIEDKETEGYYRQYIDRTFQVKGFGTVVTGSVLSGILDLNDPLWLLPSGNEVKIRRMERFGIETPKIQAGDRASLNLMNISSDEIVKGSLLSGHLYEKTHLIDTKITLYQEEKIGVWSQCMFISGNFESQAKIHLIDRDVLKNGETGLAQIHLEKDSAVCLGDRFIIRNTDSELTLGGGIIIDAYPLHHRRRTEKVISQLKKIAEGKTEALICHEIKKNIAPMSLQSILTRINRKPDVSYFFDLIPEDPEVLVLRDRKKDLWLWLKPQMQRYSTRVIKNLNAWHKNNPFDEYGKTAEELSGLVHEYKTEHKNLAIQWVIQNLFEQKLIEKKGPTYALRSHKVKFDPVTNKARQWTETYLRHSKMHAPLWSEMSKAAKYSNISEKLLEQMLISLVRRKKAYYIEETYIHHSIMDECRKKLLEYLVLHPEGLSVGQFRDLLDANRRMVIILLAQFDIEGIVKRENDLRFITEKGKKLISNEEVSD